MFGTGEDRKVMVTAIIRKVRITDLILVAAQTE
jgi:hypothetical protein